MNGATAALGRTNCSTGTSTQSRVPRGFPSSNFVPKASLFGGCRKEDGGLDMSSGGRLFCTRDPK